MCATMFQYLVSANYLGYFVYNGTTHFSRIIYYCNDNFSIFAIVNLFNL